MLRVKASKRGKPETLSLESFRTPAELGLTLPSLILGMEIDPRSFGSDYPPKRPPFYPDRTWVALSHETSGAARRPRYLLATVLTPTPAAALGMARLSEARTGSAIGVGGVSLVDVIAYRDDVRRLLGAEVERCYGALTEGYYPLDAEYAAKLTTDELPAQLDDLVDWKDGVERACGCIGRWRLVILGRNES